MSWSSAALPVSFGGRSPVVAARSGAAAPALHGAEPGGDLLDVCRLLWPEPSTVVMGRTPEPATRVLHLAPRADRPRLLLPPAPAAAVPAVRRTHAGSTWRDRLLRESAALALRTGAGRHLAELSVRIAGPSIEDPLAEVFDEPVQLAVTVGPVRANRKPVLQVLRVDGTALGFVKVGWNDLTRRLVRDEACALRTLANEPRRVVQVPQVLDARQWHDLELLVTAPVGDGRHRRRSGAPLAAMAEVALAPGGGRITPWVDSGYAARLPDRAVSAAQVSQLAAVTQLAARVDRQMRDVALPLGRWHGDWTPWNMAWSDTGVAVWDWERFETGVPVGFDVLHFSVQRELRIGAPVPLAVERAARRAPDALVGLGLTPALVPLVVDAYLLEIALRYAADAARAAAARFLDVLARRLSQG